MTSQYANPALPAAALDDCDPQELLTLSDHADWVLLRLVSCSALATLVLATAISLVQ